jgi:uncharacterized protein
MTPQESTMLNDLVNKIRQTQLLEKDPEAEQFLKQSFVGIPDAPYILTQTVLVQNIALDQAKGQIQQLQEHLQEAQSQLQAQLQQAPPAPAQHTSFLGSLLGRHDAPAPPPPQAFPPRPASAPQYYPPAPAYAPDYATAPPPPSGGSSFLRSAATTAAGVAAGALAFEGVESLLHGFGHGGGGFGGGGFGGGGLGDRPVEETVINNYYDDPSQKLGGEEHGRGASFDDRGDDRSNDRFDDRGGREASFDDPGDRFANDDRGAQLNDASYDPGDSQDRSLDDQDSGDIDDSSNFDNSGDDVV